MFARWFAPTAARRPRPSTVLLTVEPLESRLALSISPVTDTTAAPFSAAVEIEVLNAGQLFTGSGVLLDSRHVLTAAHVLYDLGGGGLDQSVTVYPGRNGSTVTPFGSAHGVNLAVHPFYLSGPAAGTDAFDLGVITLDHDVGAAAGSFGLLPLEPESYFNAGGTINILGYPAETFSGVNQYFSTGPARSADTAQITWVLRDVPIQLGSSGSPVYVKSGTSRAVVGVVSEISNTAGFATYITPAKYDWIISQLATPGQAVPAAGSQGPGVFDPTTGTWYLRDSSSPGPPDVTPFAYGAPGWVGVTGDWNADGTTTVGVVDPTTMTWYLKNNNTPGAPDLTSFAYGAPGWIPVAGDWNGDGAASIGAFDPTTGTWYLRNSNGAGAPDYTPFQYGGPGWIPVVGDWNGDGTVTIGVVDPATMTWYLRNSNSPGAPDIAPFQYGAPGWIPVAGDWDGNGTTTVGVVDPTTELWYLRNSNSIGAPDYTPFAYGAPGWQPVAGDWGGLGGLSRTAGGRAALSSAIIAPAALLDDRALLGVALATPASPVVRQAAAPGRPDEIGEVKEESRLFPEAPPESDGPFGEAAEPTRL